MAIKIEYSVIEKMTEKELLNLKDKFKFHNLNMQNFTKSNQKRPEGYAPKEVRKNIAKINQRLNEMKKEKQE